MRWRSGQPQCANRSGRCQELSDPD
jgi:hypothetical protein